MLLRSSSTPILSSLIMPKEIDSEVHSVSQIPVSKYAFLVSQWLPTPLVSPISHELVNRDDVPLLEGGEWDFERELVPWPSIRKVLSESDLQNIGHGFISSARVAADGLTNREDDLNLYTDGENLSSHQRQWSRRMSLRRHSSLPSNMSAAWQGKLRSDSCFSFRDDLQLPLPELKELDCTGEDVIEEGESTTDDPVRENHSNVGGVIIEQGDGRLASRNSVTDCSNPKCSAEGNESPRSVLERESGALDSPVQSNVVSDRWGGSHAEQTSTSGREGEAAVFLIDGERYTSISKAANGATVACNSRGCRPLNTSETLGPMFIAGGLGVGVVGGEAGGLNSGRVGDFANESGQGEEDYIKLLEVNPGHPLLLRNYARHLFEVRRDYAKAEEYFERAILAGPGDGEVLSQYAKLIWQVYRDEARAGSYFEQAVQSAPDDCYVLAAYASYLWESEDTEQDIEPLQNSAPVYKSAAPVSA